MSPRRCYCHLLIVFGLAGWNAAAQALVVDAAGASKSDLVAPDPVQIKINEGYEAQRAQQPAKAEQAFLEANRLNPTAVEALLGLAMVAQSQGKAEKAREWMARAVSAAPKRPEIHQAEARLFVDQGNLEIAAARYRKAISVFPDHAQLRLDLANLYLENSESRVRRSMCCAISSVAIRISQQAIWLWA
jgi:Tfp pilus assembly protein PilF